MAIKGGDLIHVGNQVLINRAQTAGPGSVTINRERIYELGNYFSLGAVLDTPDMSFTLNSFDVSAEFEAILLNKRFKAANGTQVATITGSPTGGDFTLTYSSQTTAAIAYNATHSAVQSALEALSNLAPGDIVVSGNPGGPYTIIFEPSITAGGAAVMTASATGLTGGTTPAVTIVASDGVVMADGTALKPGTALPMDISSVFKPGYQAANPYNVVGSVVIPSLVLESISYRFGVTENAQQNATLRGDSIYYNNGSAWTEEFTGTNTAGQSVVLSHPVIAYNGDTTAGTKYALNVSTASGTRLTYGADYTETVTGAGPGFAVTVVVTKAVPTTDAIRVSYASTDVQVYPQLSHAAVSAIRPAAIRGRNVQVFIGGTNLADRWTSIQTINVDYKVNLEKDQELGNPQAVSQTYDVPAVTGQVEVKPRDYNDLYAKICTVAGVTPGEVAGPLTTVPLELLVLLHSPDSGEVIKTLVVTDARFTLPGYSGQAGAGQKLMVTFPWESDTGDLTVYKGARP